jgi:hypothetical protein
LGFFTTILVFHVLFSKLFDQECSFLPPPTEPF